MDDLITFKHLCTHGVTAVNKVVTAMTSVVGPSLVIVEVKKQLG